MDSDRILDLLKSLDVVAIGEGLFEKYYYQGFDPKKTVEALARKKTENGVSDVEFGKDVAQIIAIGMLKGSINKDNRQKMSDDGKKALEMLMKKYAIPEGGGRNRAANVITFPRVVAAFPNVGIKLVDVIGPKDFSGPFNSSILPPKMRFQGFPAVIPKTLNEDIKKFFLMAALAYSSDMTWTINSEAKKNGESAVARDQWKFVELSNNSVIPDEQERIKVFLSSKVLSKFENTTNVVKKIVGILGEGAIPSKNTIKKELDRLKKERGEETVTKGKGKGREVATEEIADDGDFE
jgi:hypothetical protein